MKLASRKVRTLSARIQQYPANAARQSPSMIVKGEMQTLGYSMEESDNNILFQQITSTVNNDINDIFKTNDSRAIINNLRKYDIANTLRKFVALKETMPMWIEVIHVWMFLNAFDNECLLQFLALEGSIYEIANIIDEKKKAPAHSGFVYAVYLNFLIWEKQYATKNISDAVQILKAFSALLHMTLMYLNEHSNRRLHFVWKPEITWESIQRDIAMLAHNLYVKNENMSAKFSNGDVPHEHIFLANWLYSFNQHVLPFLDRKGYALERVRHIMTLVNSYPQKVED